MKQFECSGFASKEFSVDDGEGNGQKEETDEMGLAQS